MENWKKKFRDVAQEEVKAESENLTRKTMASLDSIIDEKKKAIKEELLPLIGEEIKTAMEPTLKQTEEDIKKIQGKVFIAIGFMALSLTGILILQFVK